MPCSFFRKSMKVLVLFLLALMCLSACDTKEGKIEKPASKASVVKEFVSIASTSIRDREVIRRNKPFVVTFSAPMVSEEAIKKPVEREKMPFTLVPAVEGEGKWITPTSFSFQARGGYAPGVRYRVEFAPDLVSAGGVPVQYFFSFKTRATTVQNIETGSHKAGTSITLFLVFDDHVDSAALKEVLGIADAKTGASLPFTLEIQGESQHHTVVVDLSAPSAPPASTTNATRATNATSAHGPAPTALALSLKPDVDASVKRGIGLAEAFTATISLAETGPAVACTSEEGRPSDLRISSSYSFEDTNSGEMKAVFFLSESISQRDYAKYIKIQPESPFILSDGGTTITVSEKIQPASTVVLTLLPGLAEGNGRVLQEERSSALRVGNRESRARFADAGNYLTPMAGSRVGVDVSNVDKVTLSLVEFYENNLPLLSVNDDNTRFGRQVAFREVEVSTPFNERVRKSVDIASLAGKRKGVFLLTLTSYTKDTSSPFLRYHWAGSESRMVVLSDIGLTVRSFPTGITVFANSLSSARPLENVKVRAFTDSNQSVFEGVTDKNGLFTLTRSQPWGAEKDNVPAVITAETHDDSTFLSFANAGGVDLPLTGERPYLGDGYEAFVYTPRGVFRPGETVQLKTFVRDARHLPPAPFPVQFVVNSPRGAEAARGSAMLSAEGGADFSFTVPRTAPTGFYSAEVCIPGQNKAVLGRGAFSVEDFVPPRLEVTVEPEKPLLHGTDTMPVQLAAQYLFGAPGAGLRYELGYRAIAKTFIPKNSQFAGFRFGDAEKNFGAQVRLNALEGSLGPDGTKPLDFTLPKEWAPPAAMEVMLIGSVREDGGRWVTRTAKFDYIATPYLLGVALPQESPRPGKPLTLNIAALTPEEGIADAGELTAELLQVQTNWFTVRQFGRYKYVQNERLVSVASQKATMHNGLASMQFTPPVPGNYLVRVAGNEGVTASRRFGVWGDEGAQAGDGLGRMDAVEASFDKKEYRPGDVARLSLKAPFGGTLLLGVEHAEQISTRVLEMPSPVMQVDIPVTAEMTPNATVTAWVYRPVTGKDGAWLAHRAYGAFTLPLSSAERTLTVQAETPARATPASPLAIPFTVVDAECHPVAGEFSVALVDEGILSLTAFSTPSPVDFFMAPRMSRAVTFDAFDMLLRPEKNVSPFLTPGGGGMDAYYGSLSPQQIFLAAFLPKVTTDEHGRGIANFDLPEYSGKARLMIVGAAKGSFASSSTQVPVSRDIVVETAAPLAVAPGDTFTLTVRGFVLDPALDGKATITLKACGPAVFANATPTLSFPLHSNTPVQAIPVTALEATGMATFTASISVDGRDDLAFVKTVETAVRAPFPRTSVVVSGLADKNGLTLAPQGSWFPNGASMTVAASDSPIFAILPALQFLREYPHGCLEQTVSRAWPWLDLAKWQASLDAGDNALLAESLDNNRRAILANIVSQVFTMQTADGGFAMWPGVNTSDPWKSVNAFLFLAEVKSTVPLPEAPYRLAVRYMNFLLAVPDSFYATPLMAASTKAFAAFALTRAGETPLGWLQHLSGQKMTPSGKIFLAAAKSLAVGNGSALRDLERTLANTAPTLRHPETLESTLRNTALRLYAWSLVEPASKEATQLAFNLADLLLKTPALTTQEAGFASLALGLYADRNTLGRTTATAVDFSDSTGKVFNSAASLPHTLLMNSLVPKGSLTVPPVTATVQGDGKVRVVYSVRGAPASAPAPFNNGLSITRRWLDAEGKDIPIENNVITLKQGQRVTVALTLSALEPTRDVVVSDLFPGGFELENPRLETAGSIEAPEHSRISYDMHLDPRDDRLILVYASLGKQTVEYRYTARAIFAGNYTIPPIAAEAMYDPNVAALGAGGKVKVE